MDFITDPCLINQAFVSFFKNGNFLSEKFKLPQTQWGRQSIPQKVPSEQASTELDCHLTLDLIHYPYDLPLFAPLDKGPGALEL